MDRQQEIYDEIVSHQDRPIKPMLKPRLVVSDEDWEAMRVIRNLCVDGMTHTKTQISPELQRAYRDNCRTNPLVRHYLYEDSWGKTVAFSRLEWRDGFIYPTCGVDPAARGKGYGWQVMKLMLIAAGGPLKGDLLLSNAAIVHVDYSVGWVNDGPPTGDIQPVRCAWPPPFLGIEWLRPPSCE